MIAISTLSFSKVSFKLTRGQNRGEFQNADDTPYGGGLYAVIAMGGSFRIAKLEEFSGRICELSDQVFSASDFRKTGSLMHMNRMFNRYTLR